MLYGIRILDAVSCPGLSAEDYILYALSLAEPAEADVIRVHLKEGCESCIAELRRSVEFWYHFCVAETEDSIAEPRPELRAEILVSVAGSRSRQLPARHWSLLQAVAAALTLVMVFGVSWYLGHLGVVRQPQPHAIVATQPSISVQPPADVAALQERLQRAEQALAARERTPSGQPVPAPASDAAALQQAVTVARGALTDAQAALAAEQAHATALDSDLQTQRTLLADAVRERQSAENQAKSLSDAQSQSAERERQIRTLTDRVQQLDRENSDFRTVIDRQRRELDQSLRFASLLSSTSLLMVKLEPTEKGTAAVGYAFVAGSRVFFSASSLPALPAGRTYQLWLLRGRAPAIISGGLFIAGGPQRVSVEFQDPQLVSNITALAVTDEPASGSRLPTGHKFLIGSLRS